MDERGIDLSALDPARDPARFDRMVRAVVAGALAPRLAPNPLALDILRWGKAAVACATLLAAAAWAPALARSGRGSAALDKRSDPVELVAAWAERGSIPPEVDLVAALGGSDDR